MTQPVNSADSIYWAYLPADDLVEKLGAKVEEFYEHLDRSGLWELWCRTEKVYQWGCVQNRIEQVGQDGEFDAVVVNHFRNIVNNIHVATTGTRPSFLPRAINQDFQSRQQVRLADGMLEFYRGEKQFEKKPPRASKKSLICGEGFVMPWWNPNAGKIFGMEPAEPDPEMEEDEDSEGRPVYEGDIEVWTPHPCDVIRDIHMRCYEERRWVIVRREMSRYDLAALYPKQRAEILAQEHSTESMDKMRRRIRQLEEPTSHDESDLIYVYHWFHERTPALPKGRWLCFIGEDVVLEDSTFDELNLDEIPLNRIAGEDIEGMPFGYTPMWDLLVLVDLINVGHSSAATILHNLGIPTIGAETGVDIQVQMMNGLRVVKVPKGTSPGQAITALNLGDLRSSMIQMIEKWEEAMEQLSGVNSVARGQPEASLKSGAALALVQSTFLEFTKDFQASYAHLWEEVGTQLVTLFRDHVTEDRMAAILGKGNEARIQAIKGDDLRSIDRVKVDLGPHLTRTTAGRLELAQQLLQAGLIKDTRSFFSVMETGQMAEMVEDEYAQRDLIRAENEALLEGNPSDPLIGSDGQPVIGEDGGPVEVPLARVLDLDDHVAHIQGHYHKLCDPQVRRNDQVASAILAHIVEHQNALLATGQNFPLIAAITGQPDTSGFAGAQAQPGAAPQTAETLAAPKPGEDSAAQVQMPVNPLTGERVPPPASGPVQ